MKFSRGLLREKSKVRVMQGRGERKEGFYILYKRSKSSYILHLWILRRSLLSERALQTTI